MAGITGLGNYRSTAALMAASTSKLGTSRAGSDDDEDKDDKTPSDDKTSDKVITPPKTGETSNTYGRVTAGASNDNGELSIDSFFRLMAAELANQDMSSPMSNSEMMTQMTQIAMMSAMQNFSKAMDEMEQSNMITYGTSMMGKDVLMAKIDDKTGKVEQTVGTVTRVDIYNGEPLLYMNDDNENSYTVANLMKIYEKGHAPSQEDVDKNETGNVKPGDEVPGGGEGPGGEGPGEGSGDDEGSDEKSKVSA